MDKYLKKLVALAIFAIVSVSLAGCSLSNKSTAQNNNQGKTTQNANQTKASKQDGLNIKQDKSKTEQLKKEKEVYNGQVYIQNNVAFAAMVIKDGVSESDAKVLAEKYAKELKEQYKNMKVNVQAVQSGKNIANITM